MPNTPDLPIPEQSAEKYTNSDSTVSYIRKKVESLYANEPSVQQEEIEIEKNGPQSKHQQFIQRLVSSKKSVVEIQVAWHNYYQSLSEAEKQAVWQEYYENATRQSKLLNKTSAGNANHPTDKHKENPKPSYKVAKKTIASFEEPKTHAKQNVAKIKSRLMETVSTRGQLQKKHHIQSLIFGVGVGLIVVFIFMFSFFNERIIAPLITPSKNITGTPIIIDPTTSNEVGPESKIIIPKINVEVPVVYDEPSINEKAVNAALERGVVHYPITPTPGQNGNVVIVGHSSNNLFNQGRYKFAFVMLNRLQEGDTFMLNYNNKRYIYRIYTKKIVAPNEVGVLGPTDKQATASLITCDPPGTALKRLVIIGEQISPEVTQNTSGNVNSPIQTESPASVPGNPTSLFQRLFGWIWN
jgi:LPXTG-site transpeptidase (sortase) family protein